MPCLHVGEKTTLCPAAEGPSDSTAMTVEAQSILKIIKNTQTTLLF